MARAHFFSSFLGTLAIVGLSACQDPTQIAIDLSTDVVCADLVETKVFAREPDAEGYDAERAAIDHRGPEPFCGADGRIGSIVAVPQDDKEAAVTFEVVTRVGDLACADPPVYGPGCITARRRVRFLPQTSLELPVRLSLDCLGVVCDATETCQGGRCVDAEVTNCNADDCGIEPVPFVEPESLALAWARAIPDGRLLDLAPFAGRVVGAGMLAESADALVAGYVDGGGEGWRATFKSEAAASATRVGIADGQVRVLGTFRELLEVEGQTLQAPGGGVFSATLGVDGQVTASSSFTASCLEGTISSLAFAGPLTAVAGACAGSLEVNGTTISFGQNGLAGFLGVVGGGAEPLVWPDTVGIDDVLLDPSGDVFVAGRALGTFTLGSESRDGDVFIARLDPTGTSVRWVEAFTTSGAASGLTAGMRGRLALGPGGLAYLGHHNVAFDTPAGPVAVPDEVAGPQAFVITLSPEGDVTRAHSLLCGGACEGRAVGFSPSGRVVIAAQVPAQKMFTSLDGVALEAPTGLILARLDPDGDHLVIDVGDGGNASAGARLDAVAAGSDGGLYLAGVGPLSIGGETVGQGQGFLARYAP